MANVIVAFCFGYWLNSTQRALQTIEVPPAVVSNLSGGWHCWVEVKPDDTSEWLCR